MDQPTNLRLPPYGRILQAYQYHQVHLKKMLYIYVGKEGKEYAFHFIQNGEVCTFLPYGQDYKLYEWPVAGQTIVITDTGGMEEATLKRFCVHLLGLSVQAIFLYSEEHPSQYYFNGVKKDDGTNRS